MSKIKTIKLCAKTVDTLALKYLDEKGNFVGGRTDYVPDYFPEDHYGDYVEFDIDVATGVILNWKKPTQSELKYSME
jgi:hypothetical protein